MIETTQKLFTRKLLFPQKLSYADRLLALDLPSLEKRRLCNDLTFCFKIVHNLVAGSLEDYGLRLNPSSRRGNSFKLFIFYSRIDVRKHFFANRIAPIWNSLPDEIINAPSVLVFKKKVILADLSYFLHF